MDELDPFSPDHWCELGLAERREALASALRAALEPSGAVTGVAVEIGPRGREYDLTAVVETDVGRLRTPLWSHARATVFCDASVHPANRAQLAPGAAVRDAAERLRRRLAVPYRLESRGLTLRLSPEEGVERTWTAEHSRFRKRTAVVREDRVERPGELDVRDLLAHFYTGPSLRLVSEAGEPILLPAATESEGPLVALCHACRHWAEGSHARCPGCGGDAVEMVVAARMPRR
jgi:hypothetical protein